MLVPIAGLAAVLSWPGLPLTAFTGQLENLYGFLAVFGLISTAVLGMLFKILPFLVWYATTPIPEDTGVLCVRDPTEVDLSWFEACQSATGPVFRVDGGRAPVIWVDTERGVFYCEVKNNLHSLSPR